MSIALLFPLAVLLIVLWRSRPVKRRKGMPYRSRSYLLTQGERAFYKVLRQALPPGVVANCKPRLADLVTVPAHDWSEFGRPVSGRHVDFAIVDAETTAIRCVVEFDDRSHQRRDRRERDAFVDDVLAAAGIPIVHVKAAASYDVGQLKGLMKKFL